MAPWKLALDYGTTYTTGAIAADGRVELVEVDGSPRVPSGVWVDDQGTLVVGQAAERQATLAPERHERSPKRHLGEAVPLLLGDHEVPVVEAVAATMQAVAAEALRRRGGEAPAEVRLTHPAAWGRARKEALVEAARRAGLGPLVLLPEPVAAAAHFGTGLAPGAHVAVYDLGGGTFDAAVLRRTAAGFALAGPPGGIDPLGGEDLDHLVYAHLGRALAAADPGAWEELSSSPERAWRRAAAELLAEARRAKEALSRDAAYRAYVPAPADRDLRLTREELEDLVRPELARTVEELAATVAAAGLRPAQLAGLYLAGGQSRTPLVARMVAERLGQVPKVLDEPKAVVVLGAARADGLGARLEHAAAAEPAPGPDPSGPDDADTPADHPWRDPRRRPYDLTGVAWSGRRGPTAHGLAWSARVVGPDGTAVAHELDDAGVSRHQGPAEQPGGGGGGATEVELEPSPPPAPEPRAVACPRCHEPNAPTAASCARCGLTLGRPPERTKRKVPLLATMGTAALVLLVVAALMSRAGAGDDPEPPPTTRATTTRATTTSTEAPTAGSFPNSAEEALLAQVPAGFRATCVRWEEALGEDGALAAVSCAPAGGADTAAYIQYSDRASMYADYDSDLVAVGVGRNSGSCADFDNVESTYQREGAVAGRLYCRSSEGRSSVGWTHDDSNVLSLGVRSDESTRELFDWWAADAGPLG